MLRKYRLSSCYEKIFDYGEMHLVDIIITFKNSLKDTFNNHKKFCSVTQGPGLHGPKPIRPRAINNDWPVLKSGSSLEALNDVCKTNSVISISIIFMKFHEFLMRCTVVKHVEIPSIESTNPNPLTWLVFDSVQHIIFLEFKIISKDKQTRKRLWIRIFEPKKVIFDFYFDVKSTIWVSFVYFSFRKRLQAPFIYSS